MVLFYLSVNIFSNEIEVNSPSKLPTNYFIQVCAELLLLKLESIDFMHA